jgi:hypothetical protein
VVFGRRRLFKATGAGFAVRLAPEAQEWVLELADQLEGLLETDEDDVRRLFPTAYADDPEREAGYQVLSRQGLIDRRREAIAMMRETVDREVWTEEQLTAWMGIVNDLRLVLGTRLDVSEDDQEIDFSAPEAANHVAYHQLGYLLGEIVEALTTTLPPPEEDA